MSNRCVNCGVDTNGTSAVFTKDDKGNEIKWPLCDDGPGPTCYEKHTWMLPRLSH